MSGDWRQVADIPKLARDEVQVWRIDLAHETAPEEEYLKILSSEEVERAGRLRAGEVRMQFLAGRTWLRKLLAAELEIAPKEVAIVAGEYGKPELRGHNRGRIHFNVAHTRSTVLVALSLAGAVGVDVESLDRRTDVLGVARHSLTERENADLMAIRDGEERNRAFFASWTRKEAIVKADGRGLSLPLTSFEVPVGEECWAFPIEIACASDGPSTRFSLSDIACSEQTACAIAIAGRPAVLRLLTFASV
jgi:4'-phosphopantetheinyl transferase